MSEEPRRGTTARIISAVIALLLLPQIALSATPSPVPDTSWRVNGKVHTVLVVGETIYVGGNFTTATSPSGETVSRRNLAAFSSRTGELRRDFMADAGSTVVSLASDGDALYVGGHFGQIRGVARARLAKLHLASGAVDTNFRADADGGVLALDVKAGWVYAGGAFTTMAGVSRQRLAKVSAATGSLDRTFVASANDRVLSVVRHPSQDVLFASGSFSTLSGSSRAGVGAVSSVSGAVSGPAFQSAVRPTLDLAVNEDGSMLYGALGAGSNSATGWDSASGIRRWRQTTMGDVQAVDYFGGMVYFGFHDGYQNDTRLKLLAADALTGVLAEQFRPTFNNFWGVFSVDATAQGVIAGGEFTSVTGVPAQGFVRFIGDLAPPPAQESLVDGSRSTWTYWDRGDLAHGWQASSYNDGSWLTGSAEFGYGDGDEATLVSWGPSETSKYITTYFRTRFTVDRIPQQLVAQLVVDDGAVVYLNGVEATRDNMPTGPITGSTRASSGRSGQDERAVRSFALNPNLLVVGQNVLAIEVHQNSSSSSDLSLDADLVAVP